MRRALRDENNAAFALEAVAMNERALERADRVRFGHRGRFGHRRWLAHGVHDVRVTADRAQQHQNERGFFHQNSAIKPALSSSSGAATSAAFLPVTRTTVLLQASISWPSSDNPIPVAGCSQTPPL